MTQSLKSVNTYLFSASYVSYTQWRSREDFPAQMILTLHHPLMSPFALRISYKLIFTHCFLMEPVAPAIGPGPWTNQKHVCRLSTWEILLSSLGSFFFNKGLKFKTIRALSYTMLYSPRVRLPVGSKAESD